ncbi:MAG: ACP S-malonyltransferase [Rhodoferax sp.]
MSKVGFVFPGQGTHYVGMGMELADRYREASDVFEQANDVMGMDIRQLCREGPESELVRTENAQPTIHTATIALLKVVESHGFCAHVTAGFSLGEYAALVYGGVLQFEDSVRLVQQRGMFMQNAVPQGVGRMCLITGLERPEVRQIVTEASNLGLIECSNFNCPRQIIVAGHAPAVEKAAELARLRGASATAFLNVSGPFHTSLLKEAGQQLSELLQSVPLGQARKKIASNVTAQYVTGNDDIRQLLKEHVYKPVQWEGCINTMLDDGVDTFVEIGPRHSLTTYNQQTALQRGIRVRCLHVENLETLGAFLREMERAA